ncbi:hypothetical protein V6N13_089590 [Hibiscus sabdariffa]|uniref:Peptidase A1 domain-containing protein n=1 Tax=Hibiscus sabdariffa TaxID=183260 RepID=A0ABR2QJE9_9ROSI
MGAVVFGILALSTLSHIDAHGGGFSVELIHRDSVKSPFYSPFETNSDRITNAVRRSFDRVNRFKPSSVSTKAVEAEIIVDSGEYLLNISLGTPGFDVVAIADTGSDLIWTQCKSCSQCFKQDAPLFDPSKSSTYRKISCAARQCAGVGGSSCTNDGHVASETLTLGSTTGRPVALPKTVIGCGLSNGGTFREKTSGIIGLGGGESSLISQLGTSIAGKFSYCLLPTSETGNSSKMNFGSSFGSGEGNIIIDSGTTLTLLPSDFYSQLKSAVDELINATKVEGPRGLSLCYGAVDDIEVPDVTVHFTNADVKLTPLNTFVRISETTICFTFSSNDKFAIYGNLSQMNFLVGYDTEKQTVSFKPTDCSKS